MRGPRPIPTQLKLVRGNPGHRPINQSEPAAPAALPAPPRWLSKLAKKEWRRLGPLLRDAGLLSNLDRNHFVCYCSSMAVLEEAETKLAKLGWTATNPDSGAERLSPYWYARAKAIQQIATFGAEFGLSPSSRSRVTVDPTAKMDDEFQVYLDSNPSRLR